MFRGINSATLDAKGRIALPTRIRELLATESGGHIVVTINTDERCLLLYPTPLWEEFQRGLEGLPNVSPAARTLQRLLIGHATDLEPDASGRVLLPPKLREYAGLDKKVLLVGQGRKVEIWSESGWETGMQQWSSDESVKALQAASELREVAI